MEAMMNAFSFGCPLAGEELLAIFYVTGYEEPFPFQDK